MANLKDAKSVNKSLLEQLKIEREEKDSAVKQNLELQKKIEALLTEVHFQNEHKLNLDLQNTLTED